MRESHPVDYHDFRCGLCFGTVRRELAAAQREARRCGDYMYVTRATVLGRMHELKLEQYDRYLKAERF